MAASRKTSKPRRQENIAVIHMCMLWLLMSKNQVTAIFRNAPTNTTDHKGPGRPSHALQSDSPQFHDTVELSVSLCQQRFLTLGHRFKIDKVRLKSLDGVIGVLRDDPSAL